MFPLKPPYFVRGFPSHKKGGLCDAFCSCETPCHISWGVGPRGRYVKRPWQIQPSKVKGKNGELTTKNERFRILFRIDGYWWIWILIYDGFWYNHANVGIYGGYLYLGNVNQPLERLLQYPPDNEMNRIVYRIVGMLINQLYGDAAGDANFNSIPVLPGDTVVFDFHGIGRTCGKPILSTKKKWKAKCMDTIHSEWVLTSSLSSLVHPHPVHHPVWNLLLH